MVLSDLDRTLVNRCLECESGAWEDFLDRYLPLITHIVSSTGNLRLGKIPSAWRDDLVAEVLLAIVDKDFEVLRSFRGQSSLGTYLVVVARRVAIRRLAKMRRSSARNGNIARHKSSELITAKPIEETLPIEDAEEVDAMLKQMPEQEAEVIRLYHFQHASYRAIGEHLGIPENSVGPLLSKARARMRTLGSGQTE